MEEKEQQEIDLDKVTTLNIQIRLVVDVIIAIQLTSKVP